MDRWRQDTRRAPGRAGVLHAHVAGVTQGGMEGLAQLLVQGGLVVSGSESAPCPAGDRLRALGVRVHTGHPGAPCPRGTHWLVSAPAPAPAAAPGRVDAERLSARRRGLRISTPGECLGALLKQGTGLAVAGGRDARVAAAMIGWTLTQSGRDPTVVLSCAVPQLGGWARLGQGPHVVVEVDTVIGGPLADWSALAPRLAVILDNRGGQAAESEVRGWRAWYETAPEGGRALAVKRSGETGPLGLLGRKGRAIEWLALERGADWWGADLREERGRYRFRVFGQGRFVTELRLRVPGRRNVLPALAAVAACVRLGVPGLQVRQALEEFAGVSRDFESRGSYRGVTLLDDAGDDPAAIGDVLRLARQVFGARRIWAILDPDAPGERTEREEQQQPYVAALAPADLVVLVGGRRCMTSSADTGSGTGGVPASWLRSPATAAWARDRETVSTDGAESEPLALAGALAAAGIRARSVSGLDAAILELDRHLEPGDVLVTLGAGDVGTITDAFIRRLSRDRPA